METDDRRKKRESRILVEISYYRDMTRREI